jgi:MFS family permease
MKSRFKNDDQLKGCWVVVAMIFGTAASGPAISSYVLGIFIKPVIAEFGSTRGSASGAVSLYLLFLAISIPVFGALIDYFGPRRPALASISLLAVALIAVSMAPSHSIFLMLLAIAGLVAGGATTTPYIIAIAAQFGKRRGLALGVGGGCGLGVASAVMPRIADYLITAHGWRGALLGMAVIVLCVGLPAAYLTLGNTIPAVVFHRPRRVPDIVAPFRSKHFWILAMTVMLVSIGIGGVLVHTVPLLTDRGIPRASAVKAVTFWHGDAHGSSGRRLLSRSIQRVASFCGVLSPGKR